MEVNYASRGVGNTALGLSIGALAAELLSGTFTGIVGNGKCAETDKPVSRYEAEKDARIAALETEVKLRDANVYTDSKLGELRNYMERRIDGVERELSDQRVYNATNTAALSCIGNQVNQIMSLFQLKIPNSSVCPGWGDVTVSVTPATTGA